jgi:hypothetical protein
MKMKLKILSVTAVAAMGFGLLCQQAHANPINGTIQIGGLAELNNQTVASATGVLAIGLSSVASDTGAYAGTMSDAVTWEYPFSWSPVVLPSPYLWSFTGGPSGWTYTFVLQSIAAANQGGYLDLSGNGYATITGTLSPYTETDGTWSLAIADGNNPYAVFSFSSGTASGGVPDGGMTITLLGLALTGIGAVGFKRSK